jgi:hypothetical protein
VGPSDRVIEIYDRPVHKEAPRELADDLAKTYMNKANTLRTTLSPIRDTGSSEMIDEQMIATLNSRQHGLQSPTGRRQ